MLLFTIIELPTTTGMLQTIGEASSPLMNEFMPLILWAVGIIGGALFLLAVKDAFIDMVLYVTTHLGRGKDLEGWQPASLLYKKTKDKV